MPRTASMRLVARIGAPAVALLATIALVGGVAQAHAASAAGHIYVLDNPAGPNSVSVYNRAANGALTYAFTTLIGGLGTGSALGSQGSLILADGRLFAVDGASDQISVVAIHDGALRPAGVYSSRGVAPVSLTYGDGLLYVVNAGDAVTPANVAGFRVADDGALIPLVGANRTLSAAQPGPAQVALSPDDAILAVTEKGTNTIDTFSVGDNGRLSARVSVPSVGQTPFGFAFNPAQAREMVVSDAAGGAAGAAAVTAYFADAQGARLASGPVADHQTAACWLLITASGRYAYTTNAGSGTISGYRLTSDGGLALLNASGVTGVTGAGSHPVEMTFSPGSRYLYALDAGTRTLSAFAAQADGSLAPVTLSGVSLGGGAVGLAAD
ncbi:MAG: beta-propeller fold lactonase family protein [Chloroflexota bacterium]|nr:beta-propeller fold lactonase family protein [Chloroflexota bacterium]